MLFKAGVVLVLLWGAGVLSLSIGIAFHMILIVGLLLAFLGVAPSPDEEREKARAQKAFSRKKKSTPVLFVLLSFLIAPESAWALEEAGSHGEGFARLFLLLAAILLAAKLGGHVALRLRQPEVLGELIAGIVLGNLAYAGLTALSPIAHDRLINVLSELGIVLLLFEVGLHTSVPEMLKVGSSSLVVAILGVVAPFFLGWGVGALFYPEASIYVHIFLAATLTATSVGITARVLTDLGKMKTKEAKIILGAAVIDDVLGLLVLAVVSASITAANSGGSMDVATLGTTFGLAFGFLLAAVLAGPFLSARLFRLMGALKSQGTFIAAGLVICFLLSGLAAFAGLAPIVGAFAAGLILEPVHYEGMVKTEDGKELEDFLLPLSQFLIPVFFVVMGARVDLRVFFDLSILGFALVLTVAAVIGKQICGLGVMEKGVDRLAIGLGMVPRGEVGLIFAGLGATLVYAGKPVIAPPTYAATVIMVIITTMVTPPLIAWRFSKIES